jgi:hypothetical protein
MAYQAVDLTPACDNLPTAFGKVNANFEELYAELSTPTARIITGSNTLLTTDRNVHVNNAGASTQTLPAAASMAGRTVRIVNANAGIVTIDANASETISDPAFGQQLNIKLFAVYDSVTLYCGGAGWLVVARQLKKHNARVYRSGALSLSQTGYNYVPMDGGVSAVGVVFTSGANEALAVQRAGRYFARCRFHMNLDSVGKLMDVSLFVNATQILIERSYATSTNAHTFGECKAELDLAAGDTVGFAVDHDNAAPTAVGVGYYRPELTLYEI